MSLTVEMDHPDFPKGQEFDLAGILVENKGKVELSEDQERALVARRQKPARQVLEGAQHVKVSGTSLLSAKELEGIIVESNFGHRESDEVVVEEVEDQKEGDK